MRPVLFAATLAFGFHGTAEAQQILAAGGLFGGLAQTTVVCYFHNSGTSSLGLSGTKLVNQAGATQTLTVNQCGATLPAGQTCGIAAVATNNQPYGCKTVVSPGKANARGVLEVRDFSQRTLANVELR